MRYAFFVLLLACACGDGPTSPTTGTASTTGDAGTEPTSETSTRETSAGQDVPNVGPLGCAFLVEVQGRTTADARHVVVDAAGCARPDIVTVIFQNIDAEGGVLSSAEVLVGSGVGCLLLGGPDSAAASEPGAVVMPIPGDDSPLSWVARLHVNGEVSDDVRVPMILDAPEDWPGAPDAPNTPVRRRADFGVSPVPEHVPGCELLPAP